MIQENGDKCYRNSLVKEDNRQNDKGAIDDGKKQHLRNGANG